MMLKEDNLEYHLDIGSKCNNNCFSCQRKNKKRKFKDFKSIIKEVKKIKQKKVIIYGGEPTLHPNFFKILDILTKKDKMIKIVTNARAFALDNFTKKTCRKNVEFIVKLMGPNPEIHDALTNTEHSFDQTIKGIRNIKNKGNEIFIIIILLEQNYSYLDNFSGLLSKEMINAAGLYVLKPSINYSNIKSKDQYRRLVPRYSKIFPKINKLLKENKKFISVDNSPLCLLSGSENHVIPIFEFLNGIKNKKGYIKTKKCDSCIKKEYCQGIPKNYFELFGDDEIGYEYEKPLEIAIELTSACNLKCKFCFIREYYSKRIGKELSTTQVKTLIDKIKNAKIPSVRFTGGEPLLRKDLIELVSYAKSSGLNVMLNTNGFLVNKDMLILLEKHIHNILIEFNEYDFNEIGTEEKNKLVNDKVEIVKMVAASDIPIVRIGTVATRKNIIHLKDIFEKIKEFRINSWDLYRPIVTGGKDYVFNEDDISALSEFIFRTTEEARFGIEIANGIPFCSYHPKIMDKIAKGAYCDDCHSKLVIDAFGNIKISYFSEEDLGSAFEQDIILLWNSGIAKKIKSLQILPELCRRCSYVLKCRGGSRYSAHKTKSGMDPLAKPEKYGRGSD